MFLVNLLVGYGTLLLLGQDFGLSSPNVALGKIGDKKVFEVYTDMKTWDEANDECLDRSMTLAYLLNRTENDDLRKYIREINLLPKDSTSGYWLGGVYRDGEFTWDMPDLKLRNETFFMAGWHWGEPNRLERNGDKQDCIELKYIKINEFNTSLSWNDMWCDEKRGYVCEYLGQKQPAR